MKVRSKSIAAASSLLLATMLAGCASIVSGTHQEVSVSSAPSGATVKVDNVASATTPATLTLSAKQSHQVLIELPGYKPYEVFLAQKTNGRIFGNIFFGGLIGIVIDMSDGAAYALTPNKINAELISCKGSGRAATNNHQQLFIKLVNKAEPRWQRIAQLEKY